jgi:hypothetical protein
MDRWFRQTAPFDAYLQKGTCEWGACYPARPRMPPKWAPPTHPTPPPVKGNMGRKGVSLHPLPQHPYQLRLLGSNDRPGADGTFLVRFSHAQWRRKHRSPRAGELLYLLARLLAPPRANKGRARGRGGASRGARVRVCWGWVGGVGGASPFGGSLPWRESDASEADGSAHDLSCPLTLSLLSFPQEGRSLPHPRPPITLLRLMLIPRAPLGPSPAASPPNLSRAGALNELG